MNPYSLQPKILTGGFSPYDEDWQFKHTGSKNAIINTLEKVKAINIPQSDIFKVAKIYAERAPEVTVQEFENFGLTDQTLIFEIAKACAEGAPGATAKHFKNFDLADQAHIFEIAKICAEGNPWITAEHFKNFGLADQTHIFEIAKMCAERIPGVTAQKLNNFGLADQNHIFEIVKMCADKAPRETVQQFESFRITDQAHIFEIAKICAEGNPWITAEKFKNFGLTDQAHIFEIARECAKRNPWPTAEYFQNFGLTRTDQARIFEIVKICAEKDPETTTYRFENFRLTDQNHIFEIVKMCVEKQTEITAREFKNFRLTDQTHIIEIVKRCFEINPLATANHFQNFDLIDHHRFEVAKMYTENYPWIAVAQFKNFDITDQAQIFELVRECAERNLWATTYQFSNFGLTDQTRIFELVKEFVERNPGVTVNEFKNFGLTDQVHILEIAKMCFKKSAQTVMHLANFGISDPTSLLELLNIQDSFGVSGLDQLVAPPITESQVPSIFKLIKIHHASFANSLEELYKKDASLAELFISRAVERDPTVVRGGTIPSEYAAFVEALKNLSTQQWLHNLLAWEYKMNQNLPLTVDVLDFVATYQDSPQFVRLKLALQTHPNFQEVKHIIENGKIDQPFPEKKDFFNLSIQAQREFLCRAQVLRERAALAVANHVLKESSTRDSLDQEVLQLALKLYKSTGVEGSSQTMRRLMALVENNKFDTQTKALALQAISEIEHEPTAEERKTFLINQLKKSQDPLLQKALLDALARYSFSNNENLDELIGYVQKTASNALDSSLKHSLVFLATTLPDERALKVAYDLVNAGDWDVPGHGDLLRRKGDYSLFTFRPSFHDSKNSINSIIGQRLVDLHKDKLEPQAVRSLETFKSDKSSQPALLQLENNILGIDSGSRYIPMQLFLPPGTVCFRGLNQRKGDALSEASFIDFWLKGTGSSDLSLFSEFANGTWSKVGQMFTSTTLDYVMYGYFNENGLLMTIPAEALNEQMLRRNVRLQHEGSIHYVTYSKLSHYQISQVFLSTSKQDQIQKITTSSADSKKLDKIARRNLERAQCAPYESGKKSARLLDKIRYFKPEDSLTTQITQFMQKDKVRQATLQEIIDETLKRHIMLTNVSDHITDPVLKKAFEKGPEIKPMMFCSE